MAFYEINDFSRVLGKDVRFEVILPEAPVLEKGPCKTLLLLHGKGDNQTKWLRRTSVERYAKPYGLAVIMPDARRSFYADMEYGGNYWQYISQELPDRVQKLFPCLSGRREDRYVAGLSMGGYGALKLALNHPEQYGKAASFSGAVHVIKRAKENGLIGQAAFGSHEKIPGTGNDLYTLVSRKKETGQLPELYLCCGTEDFLYQDNLAYHSFLEEQSVSHCFESWRGVHDWDFWDEAIRRGIRFFCEGKAGR